MEKISIAKKTKTKDKTQKPSMYMVFFSNDDYTTMEFVIEVLEVIFHKSRREAVTIMMEVHTRNIGLVGIYTHEIAHTRVAKVQYLAEREGFPLLVTIEETL